MKEILKKIVSMSFLQETKQTESKNREKKRYKKERNEEINFWQKNH